jgi:hypothetical protein
MIGRRTKEPLAAAKRRGTRLGNPNGLRASAQAKGAPAAAVAKAERVAERDRRLEPMIADIRANGFTSLRQIGGELNAREVPAPRRGTWSAPQVLAVLRRFAA